MVVALSNCSRTRVERRSNRSRIVVVITALVALPCDLDFCPLNKFIKLLSCLRSDIVILDTLIVLLTYLLTYFDLGDLSCIGCQLVDQILRQISESYNYSFSSYNVLYLTASWSVISRNLNGGQMQPYIWNPRSLVALFTMQLLEPMRFR